jgi:hypothetical protein
MVRYLTTKVLTIGNQHLGLVDRTEEKNQNESYLLRLPRK